MIKRDDSPRKNGNSELLNTRSNAKSAGINSKTLKNDDHTVGIINKSPKREPTNEKKSSKFSWKILFCGFNSHGVNLNDKDKTSSIKRWKFREIIFKKNSNVLKILQLSRKTDDDIALKILSPVPATDELVNLNNDVLTQNKDENLPNIKNLLLPIEESDRNKKCLIIDLDETLVHSSFKYVDRADFKVGVEIEGIVHQVYVLKRPFVDEFLTALGDLFECVLFTASLSKYADPVADFIDKNRVFRHRLFREACVYHVGSYVKDLSLLGRPLDQVVILDNSPASFLFHPNNAVQISSWFDDTSDTALLDLIPYFVSMAKNADVPNYLDAHDPDTPCAAIGCKGLSTNPLPSNNSCNSSNNNVITQLDNCSTSENNFSSQTIASCISHKQHENYNMTQKNISTTTNDLEKTSSNYPIVKRKQLNSVGKNTVDSTNKRHQSSHQGKTNDVKDSVGRKAVTSSPKSDASLEHAEKKTDVASSTQKARLIISETNQMRKDKFLKEKRTT